MKARGLKMKQILAIEIEKIRGEFTREIPVRNSSAGIRVMEESGNGIAGTWEE